MLNETFSVIFKHRAHMQKGGKKNILLLYNCVCLFVHFAKPRKRGQSLETLFSQVKITNMLVVVASFASAHTKGEWKSSSVRRNFVQNGNVQSILVETICHLQKKRLGKSVWSTYTASGTLVSVQIIVNVHEKVSKKLLEFSLEKNRQNVSKLSRIFPTFW